MSVKVTNYTSFETEQERKIYSMLKSSIADTATVNRLYDEIIRQLSEGNKSPYSLYRAGNIYETGGTLDITMDEETFKELIANMHKRNNDNVLRGKGNLSIENSAESGKLISFLMNGAEVAYIDGDGSYVGKMEGLDTSEISEKISKMITSTDLSYALRVKVDKDTIINNTTQKLKEDLLPGIITDHLADADKHISLTEKQKYDKKLDQPETMSEGILGIDITNKTIILNELSSDLIKFPTMTNTGNLKDVTINTMGDLITYLDNMTLGPTIIEDDDFGVY